MDGWMNRQADVTKLMVAFIIFRICLKIENYICGPCGIIFFNNTPSDFPFRFIIIINHTLELLFRFYVFFRYYSIHAHRAQTTVL